MPKHLPIIAALIALFAGTAGADVLLLRDGRLIEGHKLTKTPDAVTIHYENGDVVVSMDLVEDTIIEGAESSFTPRTEEEKEQFAKGLVPFEGKWVRPDRRDKLIEKKIEEKKAEIEELKAHQVWRNRYKEQTKHFEFEHTLPPHVFEYFRDMMEAFYSVFEKNWKVRQPKDRGRLKVCFYTNLSDFQRISGVGGGVRGYFKFGGDWELNIYYDRIDPRYTEEVMFHETTHYLQQLLDPDFHLPHFVAESMAEYYGASVYDVGRKKLVVGLMQEGRLAGIQTDVAADKMLGLKTMLETDGMYEHYSYGWCLIHMLMSDKGLCKKWEQFVKDLVWGRDVKREMHGVGTMKTVKTDEMLRVFMKDMGLRNDEDLAELEKKWHAYIKEKVEVVTARGKEKAAQAAERSGRPIRAARLYKEALETGNASALCHHRYAEILMDKGQTAEAIELWKKAISMDPLESEFYEALGTAQFQKGDKEEGTRLLELALELNPDDYWLEFRIKELLHG